MPASEAPTQQRSAHRYIKELTTAVVAYMVVLFAATLWLRANPESALRPLVALTPMLPVALAFRAIVRFLRRSDEMIQRMQVEALAIAFAGTALLVLTYGFLEVAGLPRLSVWWVWVVMGILWLVGGVIARRRYR